MYRLSQIIFNKIINQIYMSNGKLTYLPGFGTVKDIFFCSLVFIVFCIYICTFLYSFSITAYALNQCKQEQNILILLRYKSGLM